MAPLAAADLSNVSLSRSVEWGMPQSPLLIFLAGPNGAGKSTFYETYLKTFGLPFVNADRICAGLDIPDREAAAVADALRTQMVTERHSFITETVFSDPAGAKLQFLRRAMDAGYLVLLCYIGIASPALSEARVIQRVQHGGHDVPSDRLERRFHQSLQNLAAAMRFVSQTHLFDNSSTETPYRLVLSLQEGQRTYSAEPFPGWLGDHISDCEFR